MLEKAVGHQPTGVEISKGRHRVGSLVLGEEVCYQPTGVEISNGMVR